MLTVRTDIPRPPPAPLSSESLDVMFDRIRLDLGLPLAAERRERLAEIDRWTALYGHLTPPEVAV